MQYSKFYRLKLQSPKFLFIDMSYKKIDFKSLQKIFISSMLLSENKRKQLSLWMCIFESYFF